MPRNAMLQRALPGLPAIIADTSGMS